MGTRKPANIFPIIVLICTLNIGTAISWTGNEPRFMRSENRVSEVFRKWRETHGIIYKDDEETGKGFESFKRNLRYVMESNLGRGFSVGLNRFADLSNEEFRERYFGGVERPVRLSQLRGLVGTCNAPLYVDWREKGNATPVKDQGVNVADIEDINKINNRELVSLSEQAVKDCDKTNNGCDGGYNEYAFQNLEQSEKALLCAIVNQPIRVGVHGSSNDFQLYTGGVYDGECSSDPDDINHSVFIVGYNSERGKDYWIVKNSWGSDWGIDGYMYIRRNTNLPHGLCAINAQAFYPTQMSSIVSLNLSPASAPPLPPPLLSPAPPSSRPPPPPPPPLSSPPPPILSPPPPPILSPPPPPSPSLSPPPTPILSPPPPPTLSPPPPPTLSPPPPPSPSLSPPPPPPYHPPSPPPPLSHHCGEYSYCSQWQTCCCLYEFSGYCMIHGCCDYVDGVCCSGTDYCCPRDYPICDPDEDLCLKKSRDYLGVPARKKNLAKLKLPWRNNELTEMSYEPLQWRKAAMR